MYIQIQYLYDMIFLYNNNKNQIIKMYRDIKRREPDISTERQQYEPLDTVSKIVWDLFASQPRFATASWDGFVRYYEMKEGQRSTYSSSRNQTISRLCEWYLNHPVLTCAISNNEVIVAGLANGDIVAVSPKDTSSVILLGNHDAPICQIFFVPEMAIFLSFGFDDRMKIWSLDTNNNNYLQKQYQLPFKTSTAAYKYPLLLVASKNRGNIFEVSKDNIANLNIPNSYDLFQMEPLSNFTCSKISTEASCAILGCADGRMMTMNLSLGNGYGRGMSIKVSPDPVKSRSQKMDEVGGKKATMGAMLGVQIMSLKQTPLYIAYGTFFLQIYDLPKKAIHATVKGLYQTNITAATLCPKNIYLVYGSGNDWSKGLQSLKEEKRPKLRAIKFKESELHSFAN